MTPSESLVDVASVQAALSRWFAGDARQGLFATDTQFRIVIWNRWMEIHSGQLASAVIGRSLFDVCPDTVERGVKDYYQSALDGRVTVISHGLHRFLLSLPPTSGDFAFEQMPQSGHIAPLVDGDRVVGTVTVLEDVSDRVGSEANLRTQIEAQQQARATAELALRSKDEFLSTLSHEIRTPLSAVLGWSRILLARDTIEPELLQRALTVIERNAATQAKMIDDMLDMARIVAGKLRLELRPVDLLSVVIAAVDVVTPSASAKRIMIRPSFAAASPQVLGDHDRLQQVVWNLLSNAVKFTPSGGVIDVRLDVMANTARVVVRDTGQGISEEFLPHVFERFRQDDASSTRRFGGLGLGLALVRDLISVHGGTVSAVSAGENRGSTFTIELPMMPASAAGDEPDRHRLGTITAPLLHGVRVLVVDDEADARDLAVAVLQQCGAHVSACTSSSDAMSVLVAARPDALPHVIVCDIGMPQEDGYHLIRKVRSLQPERGGRIPAVTLTGYVSADDVTRALTAGYQLHVAKPLDPAALVAAVAGLAGVEARRVNR